MFGEVSELDIVSPWPGHFTFRLEQAYEGVGSCFKVGEYQRLNTLHLHRLKRLRWVRVEE
ncbi:hypothetical protein ACSBR2_014142 [Camellia fascicularis]